MTVTLNDLSFRQRATLLMLDEHVYYSSRKGFSRRVPGTDVFTFARVEPLHAKGLVMLGEVGGRKAAVPTPAGQRLADEIRARRKPKAVVAVADEAGRQLAWWQE